MMLTKERGVRMSNGKIRDQPIKILAADLSLRRPGFTILLADPSRMEITVETMLDINSRGVQGCHGMILDRIY